MWELACAVFQTFDISLGFPGMKNQNIQFNMSNDSDQLLHAPLPSISQHHLSF
jgi:hypothetical protein